MAAKRGTRKPSRKAKAGKRGGLWPLAAVATVLGIVAYDHWPAIKPELANIASTTATAQPAPKVAAMQVKPSVPAPQVRPFVRSSDFTPLPPAPIPVSLPTASSTSAVDPNGVLSESFGMCGQGTHFNCVFDGGTFWVRGAKIRIADIDAPAANTPHCEEELRRGNAAKVRLLALLNAGPFTVQASPDSAERDGAKLRRVIRNSQSFGDVLVREGLAHRSSNGPVSWCA